MKTILCFGDSNTWGYSPAGGPRFDIHTRWAGVLRDTLGESHHIIEEGLCGRTTVLDDAIEGGAIKNGKRYLPACIHSHCPFELFVLLLGTNDLKQRFNLPPGDIAAGAWFSFDCTAAHGKADGLRRNVRWGSGEIEGPW